MSTSNSMSKRHESRLGVMARDDQITELPDSLFEHILSFLPTKEAITICLSFKRWRHLRLSLPSLDLDDVDFHNLRSFLQYIDTVMSMRDDSETLKRFYLVLKSTRGTVAPMKINKWITAAMNFKVKHVEIHSNFNIEIPPCIFKCNTITILKLSGVKITNPSSVDLPSLQVLHLINVMFSNIECVSDLLYGCLLLQDLALKYCNTDKGHLGPIHRNWAHYPWVNNLVSADVYEYPFALKSLSNVTALRINTIDISHRLDIPTFHNLIRMEIRYYSGVYASTLWQFLQNSPKLETLIIDEFNGLETWGQGVPQCVSLHLKEFHLGNFKGLDNEFELVRYILENAGVLKIISIRFHIMSKANSQQEIIIKRLSSYPKSSENCTLLFS